MYGHDLLLWHNTTCNNIVRTKVRPQQLRELDSNDDDGQETLLILLVLSLVSLPGTVKGADSYCRTLEPTKKNRRVLLWRSPFFDSPLLIQNQEPQQGGRRALSLLQQEETLRFVAVLDMPFW